MRRGRGRRWTAVGLAMALALTSAVPVRAQDWRDDREDDAAAPETQIELAVRRLPPLQPGFRPTKGSLEHDLWLATDRVEKKLAKSKLRLRDDALESYVRSIVCRLVPEHCADIRLYLVRKAGFNASMMPNGVMQVWTGLFLRCENEAQLAFVLAHELSHYLHRHSVARWEAANTTMGIANFFAVATMAFGVGVIGSIGQLAAAGSVMGYTRDQEREADRQGLELLAKAGYDPAQGAALWQAVSDESAAAASSPEDGPGFWSSHPMTKERLATARAFADDKGSAPAGERGEARYRDILEPYWPRWMQRELRADAGARTGILLDRQIARGQRAVLARYYRGEMFRRRGTSESLKKALAEFEALEGDPEAPSVLHRATGLTLWQLGRDAEAVSSFERYLRHLPDAEDREMIQSYIDDLR